MALFDIRADRRAVLAAIAATACLRWAAAAGWSPPAPPRPGTWPTLTGFETIGPAA